MPRHDDVRRLGASLITTNRSASSTPGSTPTPPLPENQRKLDAVEQLGQLADEADTSLIELAIAFVLRHPAVAAAIIGPRTMAQLNSQLAAADVELAKDMLDRIDQINPPGVTINPADNGWVSPAMEPAGRRR